MSVVGFSWEKLPTNQPIGEKVPSLNVWEVM